MWSSVFCFLFISAVSAAPRPKLYNFLPHYGNQVPSGLSNKAGNNMFLPSDLQTGMATPISVEILLPPGFTGTAAGGPGFGTRTNSMFPGVPLNLQPGVKAPISIEVYHPGFQGTAAGTQGSGTGFIKYSLPKAPGGKSVEFYYPYNFAPGEVLPNVLSQIPNILNFNFPAQTGPKQPQPQPQPQPPRQVVPPRGNNQPFIFDSPPQTGPQQQPPRAAVPQASDPQRQIQHDTQGPAGQVPTQP